MRGVWAGAVLAMLVGLAVPASAASESAVNARIEALLGDSTRFETSIKLFEQAVAADSREDVAAFVRYPIVVTIGGHKRVIRSARDFLQRYEQIVTPGIVTALAGQSYGDLAVSRQGIELAGGQVRFSGMCLDRRCRQVVPKVVNIQPAGTN